MSTIARPRIWQRFLLHGLIATTALGLGFLSWFIAKPLAIRLYETVPGQRVTVTAAPNIEISLDADSSVAVSNTEPPRIELLRGNAYFDVRGEGAGKLQVKVGTTQITYTGTRFSVIKRANGGTVAVADGQVEIQVESGTYLVGAQEGVDFDGIRITNQRMISEAAVAPWRSGR